MSVHWSSEIMKWEYRELQATAMSVDFSGNNVLLAGRRWLAIKHINIDDDAGDIVKKYPRHSKYDAVGAEWCQTYPGQKLCAIAHPGGDEIMLEYAGHDASTAFRSSGHSKMALKALDRFLIGELPLHERMYRRPGGIRLSDIPE